MTLYAKENLVMSRVQCVEVQSQGKQGEKDKMKNVLYLSKVYAAFFKTKKVMA